MCLIITAFAAVFATIVWYAKAPSNQYKLSTLVFMYWGATLMWLVDGFFSIAGGEAFLDLSANDAFLGLTVVLCGLVFWTMLLLISDPKKVLNAILIHK